MRWLLTSVVSCAVFAWAWLATFVPLSETTGLQFVFVWPPVWRAAASSIAAAVAVTALYFAVVQAVRRRAPERVHEARRGRWLAPIAALGVVVVGVAPAVPGIGERGAPLAYFLLDVRPWWLATVVVLVLVECDRLTGEMFTRRIRRIGQWSSESRLLLLDAVVFTVVILSAIVSTRHLRFATAFHGDEPKYVRYCEVWYQGGGFEISGKRPFADVPLDAPPQVLRIVPLALRGVAEETAALAGDIGRFLASPRQFQWNRAVRDEGFVTGKRGGTYEIYQPGASLFIFPGYFLDRYLLSTRAGYNGEFPADMIMSNVALLTVFGLAAVALFRLLRHALQSEGLALIWAMLAMLSLPTTAFAFQFYPELPALLLIVLITTYVWFHAPVSGVATAAAAGAIAAGLGWFHPRFLLISGVYVAAGAIRTGRGRGRLAFAAGAAAVYLSLVSFAYHVTGSLVPTALWDAPGAVPTLDFTAVPQRLLAYSIDHVWGIAPHAPVFLGALAGLAVLARQSPARVVLLVAAGLALGIPAAGHTLHAAGGTPGRLIMAVVPLFVLPVAVLARRFWTSRPLRAATIASVVLSLEAGFTYNWHHLKAVGAMRTTGMSGWRPNLAFPILDGSATLPANTALLLVVLVLAVLSALVAWHKTRDVHRVLPTVPRGAAARGAVVFAAIMLGATTATAFNRDWTYWGYLREDEPARQEAAAALVEHDRCRVCFTSVARAIDWRWLQPNAAEGVNVETAVDRRTATLNVVLAGDERVLRFGRMFAEFGDGTTSSWAGIVAERRITHTYKEPGQYAVVVWLQLRNGERRADRRTIVIAGN